MNKMFLTREEVAELTGAKTKSTQLKQLAIQNIEFLIARDGHPRVLRNAIEERLGLSTYQKIEKEPILFAK